MRRSLLLLLLLCVAVGSDVSVARRLLMAGGGSGSFVIPEATVPPFDASWSRSAANPILVPSVAWEETAVVEPSVMYDGGWRMWYRGGWSHEAIGYATSSDGVTWTKDAGNPVYGLGGSGESADIALPNVQKIAGTYWMWAVKHPFGIGGTNAGVVATSSDGLAWTTQASSITLPSGKTLWGNNSVWIEGGTWYRLQEAGPSTWEVYLYTSSDGLAWSIANSGNPLTTLQVAAGGMYGGPSFAMLDGSASPTFSGTYHLWYHAAPASGNNPTDIYHATSSDRITWTQTSPNPLTHTGTGDEADQIADPNVVVHAGTAYLFYDTTINATSSGNIKLATAPAGY